MNKQQIDWAEPAKFSVCKVTEGGAGQRWHMERLKEAGIPRRCGYSIYVGQSGIEVPRAYEKQAEEVINCNGW